VELDRLVHNGEVTRVRRGAYAAPAPPGTSQAEVHRGSLLAPGQTPHEALIAEKRREDRVRELGWQVVRWTWADLADQSVLVARLKTAFRRGRDLSV
jgi:hypothetical protein